MEEKKHITPFNVSKSQRGDLVGYLNKAILDKYPETKPKSLLTKTNILKNICTEDTEYLLPEVCAGFIRTIANKSEVELTPKLWTPHVIIIEPDTISVTREAKEVEKAVEGLVLEEVKVIVHQIYAKHKRIDSQIQELLQVDKAKKVLNVVVCTPNRLTKLSELKAVDYTQLKCLIIDCTKNEKDQTIFDYKETRNDTIELIGKFILKNAVKNKLKIYFH